MMGKDGVSRLAEERERTECLGCADDREKTEYLS